MLNVVELENWNGTLIDVCLLKLPRHEIPTHKAKLRHLWNKKTIVGLRRGCFAKEKILPTIFNDSLRPWNCYALCVCYKQARNLASLRHLLCCGNSDFYHKLTWILSGMRACKSGPECAIITYLFVYDSSLCSTTRASSKRHFLLPANTTPLN